MSNVADFYSGRSVFVTGATGFIGKAVVEKLLRSSPDIEAVYILIRGRKDLTPAARGKALLEDELFAGAIATNPGCTDKVKFVEGDLTSDKLGISDDMQTELAEKVSCVLHMAATVQFNEPIKVAVSMNIYGLQKVIALVKSLKECAAFVHTSTAYTHSYRTHIDEVLYEPTYDPVKFLQLMELMDTPEADAATPRFIAPHPNTYTFTKCIAEALVQKECVDIPTSIVRPAIVIPAIAEPAPGWTDNMNGPSGTFILVGAGLCRIFGVDGSAKPAQVPVDLVSNCIVAAGWNTAKRAAEGKDNMQVYNATGTTQYSWRESMDLACATWEKFPLDKMLVRSVNVGWIDKSAGPASSFIYEAFSFISHTVPGHFIDLMRTSVGQKPMASRAYRRLNAMLREYRPWSIGNWSFGQTNLKQMAADFSEEDKKAYLITADSVSWPNFMENYMLGLRKYILKDGDTQEQMEAARKKYSQRWWIGLALRVAITWSALRASEAVGLIRQRKISSRISLLLVLALAQASRLARIVTLDTYTVIEKIGLPLSQPGQPGERATSTSASPADKK